MGFGQIWAAAVLVQLLLWLLWPGCSESSGCVAVVAAAAAVVVHSVDAAAGPVGCHQVVQSLDVLDPDHLHVAAQLDSERAAAAAAVAAVV